jgi:hypothetical protein
MDTRTETLEFIAFLACLDFVVLNSAYHNNILKPKQVLCFENIYYLFIQTSLGKITRLIPCSNFDKSHNLSIQISM